MRGGLNRLIAIVLLAAIVVFAAVVAIEAGAALAGRDDALGPVDYRSWWQSTVDWDPGGALLGVIFVGVALLGLALLALQLWPSRRAARERGVEVVTGEHGRALLVEPSARDYLRARQEARPWIRSSAPRLRLSGRAATLRDRPRASRPYDAMELSEARTELTDDLTRLGLEAEAVEIDPLAPQGRGTSRVR